MHALRLPVALILGSLVLTTSACKRDIDVNVSVRERTDSAGTATPSTPGAPDVPAAPGAPSAPDAPPVGAGETSGERAFNASGANQAFACKGEDIAVNGSRGTITLTGVCGRVAVNGSNNTVSVESAREIAANGPANTISYVEAGTVRNDGPRNTISRR